MNSRMQSLALAAVTLSLIASVASAQTFNLDYRLGNILPTGILPSWVEAGDLDNDGLPELVVLNAGTGDFNVFQNLGSMNFTPSQTLVPAAGPTMCEIADMNGDGANDIVVCCRQALFITIFFGDGTGAFPTRGDFSVGFDPTTLMTFDYNNDGALDVFVVSQNTHNVQVMTNDGAGNLVLSASSWGGSFPSDIAAGDLDNDGDEDILISSAGFSAVMVIENLGNGAYAPKNFFNVGFGPLSLAIVDVNQDRLLDVVTANVGSDDVSVQINQGNLQFGGLRSFQFPAGRAPTRVVVTDTDNRNGLDIAVTTINGSSVSVLTNNIWGNFSSSTPAYFTGATPVSLCSADLDGDHADDLCVLNLFQNDMMILENRLDDNRYPGTDEDLTLFSSVNSRPLTTGGAESLKLTKDGDMNSWFLVTPSGQFTSGQTFLGIKGFYPGSSPYSGVHPSLYITPEGEAPAVIPLGHLSSTGQMFQITLPPGAAPLRYVVQGLTLSIFANNGYMATTDAHEFRVE